MSDEPRCPIPMSQCNELRHVVRKPIRDENDDPPTDRFERYRAKEVLPTASENKGVVSVTVLRRVFERRNQQP